MPVLLKDAESAVYPTVDVEALVNEVRERLCLKQKEKYCSRRRSAPYYAGKSHSAACEHSNRKRYTSPRSCLYQDHCKQRQHNSCSSCTYGKKLSCSHIDNSPLEDPRSLLEKLLAEQSLIQEAVRRLQSVQSKNTGSKTQSPAPTSAANKFFPFVDEDSCDNFDQFSNLTPSYSESEDDSVSQHSVDL